MRPPCWVAGVVKTIRANEKSPGGDYSSHRTPLSPPAAHALLKVSNTRTASDLGLAWDTLLSMIAVLVNFVVSGDGSKPESSLPLEVDPSMTLDDVSAILEVETGVPNELMKFVLSARVLGERGKTLSDYNVREGDVVHVTRVPHSPPLAPSAVPAPYRAPHHGGGRRRSNMGHRGHRLDPEVYSSLSLEGRMTGPDSSRGHITSASARAPARPAWRPLGD